MATDITVLKQVKGWVERLASPSARVARFSYRDRAYQRKEIEGVQTYDYNNDQNIPLQSETDTNPNVLDTGIRSQGASIARNFQNHFTGRVSFNLNLVVDLLVMIVNWVLNFTANDMHEYSETTNYLPGDKAYVVVSTDNGKQLVKYEFIRNDVNPSGTTGIPPTDTLYWKPIRNNTSLARVLVNVPETDLNEVRQTGTYTMETNGNTTAIQHFPPIPPHAGTVSGILAVRGDLNNNRVTTQVFTYRDVGYEYTRTLSGGTVIQDWFKTKDPKGITIVGVPGLWAFRVGRDEINAAGNNQFGHLYLFYDDEEFGSRHPVASIDREQQRIQAEITVRNNSTQPTTIPVAEWLFVIGDKGGYVWKLTTVLSLDTGEEVTIHCPCFTSGDTDINLPTPGDDVFDKLIPAPPGEYDVSMIWEGTSLIANETYGHLLWNYTEDRVFTP